MVTATAIAPQEMQKYEVRVKADQESRSPTSITERHNWRATCAKEFLDELVLQDLQNYRLAMIDAGLSNRTVKNRLTYVGIFLHKQGAALSLSHKYTKKKPRQYNGELHKLLEASPKEERQVWDAFRMSS